MPMKDMPMQETATANAVELLREDHEKVKQLFEEFEQAEDRSSKQEIAHTALKELLVHAKIEEEIFYPAMRRASKDGDMMAEADEEHHVAKMLIDELQAGERLDPEHFDAKFMVLAENVKHHIEEEESEMLPKAEQLDLDLEELGQELWERKQQLMQDMESGTANGSRSSRSASRSSPRASSKTKRGRRSR